MEKVGTEASENVGTDAIVAIVAYETGCSAAKFAKEGVEGSDVFKNDGIDASEVA